MRHLIENRDIAWHAVRGIDLAGISEIFHSGFTPADHYPAVNSSRRIEFGVCFSASPSTTWAMNRPADSFLVYTLGQSISLAVEIGAIHPKAIYGGFHDEIRVPNGRLQSSIRAVVIPEQLADVQIKLIQPMIEPMKVDRCRAYLNRSIQMLEMFGADLKFIEQLEPYVEMSQAGMRLDHQETADMQNVVLRSIDSVFSEFDMEGPTLRQAVALCVAGRSIPIVEWSADLKLEVARRNGAMPTIDVNGVANQRIRSVEVRSTKSPDCDQFPGVFMDSSRLKTDAAKFAEEVITGRRMAKAVASWKGERSSDFKGVNEGLGHKGLLIKNGLFDDIGIA